MDLFCDMLKHPEKSNKWIAMNIYVQMRQCLNPTNSLWSERSLVPITAAKMEVPLFSDQK
jgi:hypothetical protein